MTSMIYEIRVDGRLPEHSREGFCGLQVEEVPMGLILRGMVIDESHLLGIISEFRRLKWASSPCDRRVDLIVGRAGRSAGPWHKCRHAALRAGSAVTCREVVDHDRNRVGHRVLGRCVDGKQMSVDHTDDVDVVTECSTDVDHLAGDPGRKPATDQHHERTTTRRCDPQSLDTVGCGPVLRLPCFRSPDRHRRPRSRSGAARRVDRSPRRGVSPYAVDVASFGGGDCTSFAVANDAIARRSKLSPSSGDADAGGSPEHDPGGWRTLAWRSSR